MREMTLINDQKVTSEKENLKLGNIIKDSQKEIEEYYDTQIKELPSKF